MCLVTTDIKHKIAKEDIVCYKLMHYLGGDEWRTPYQNFLVVLDVIEGKKDFCADDGEDLPKDITPNMSSNIFYVGGGYIHTYASEIDAKVEKNQYPTNYLHLSVFECIIPKGTKYLEGQDCDYMHEYASERIRFVKKIYD